VRAFGPGSSEPGMNMYVQTAEPSDSQWAATVAVRAEGLLFVLRDNVERAGEPGSGGHGATRDAGWLAGAWDEPTHEQPQRGELSPKTRHDPVTGVRDAAAWWPLSSCCIGSGALALISLQTTSRWARLQSICLEMSVPIKSSVLGEARGEEGG
jgi:hypothetical protein